MKRKDRPIDDHSPQLQTDDILPISLKDSEEITITEQSGTQVLDKHDDDGDLDNILDDRDSHYEHHHEIKKSKMYHDNQYGNSIDPCVQPDPSILPMPNSADMDSSIPLNPQQLLFIGLDAVALLKGLPHNQPLVIQLFKELGKEIPVPMYAEILGVKLKNKEDENDMDINLDKLYQIFVQQLPMINNANSMEPTSPSQDENRDSES